MQLIHDINHWQHIRQNQAPDETLGFVPTMGNLHAGHMSLVHRAQTENNHTLVSLFINPTQFNNPDDFTHYPRTLAEDIALLKTAKVDYCLIPDTASMYPDDYCYQITEQKDSLRLEGVHRPGHFTGMLTVVMKLLNVAQATRAYFGEKDYQQLQLIQGMVKAFFIRTEIIGAPIVREDSGLAFSSRNQRLSPRAKALAIEFARLFHHATSITTAREVLAQLPIDVDYIEEWKGRRLAAVTIEGIRLIDNYAI